MVLPAASKIREEAVMSLPKMIPLPDRKEYSPEEMSTRASEFNAEMQRRRSIRQFSNRPVAREIIEDCVHAAGSAPSGANLQPWHFVVVSDGQIKRQIREGAEAEEREFYTRRATAEWLEVLAPLGTDEHKPFLETAPYLIVIFGRSHSYLPDGRKIKNYYVSESVGIATGLLIAALHHAGLATLTHTPSPMGFLNKILSRPSEERPYLVLVTGYPAEDAQVPDIHRKPLSEIASFL
jgi:iodotyrosine deiodinase